MFSWVSTMSVTSRVAVVMTDGNSNVDSARTVPEAVALHQAGVHVVAVSVGRIYNATELRAIASRNGTVGNVFHADTYDQLDSLATAVQAAICNGQSAHKSTEFSQKSRTYINCLKLNLTYLRTPFLTDLFFHMCRLVFLSWLKFVVFVYFVSFFILPF